MLATLGNRFSSLVTLPEQIGFFFTDDHFVDAGGLGRARGAPTRRRERLIALADALEKDLDLDAAPAGRRLRGRGADRWPRQLGVKAGELIHPARVALTGQSRSAGHLRGHGADGRARARWRGCARPPQRLEHGPDRRSNAGELPRRRCWASWAATSWSGSCRCWPCCWPPSLLPGFRLDTTVPGWWVAVLRLPLVFALVLIVLRPAAAVPDPAPEQLDPRALPTLLFNGLILY